MGRSSQPELAVSQSVLDRLIDLAPKVSSEPPPTRAQSIRQLKSALQRDLEWLLNTRRIADDLPEDSEVLRSSLYWYGLPDLSALSIRSPHDQVKLIRHLESVIAAFEPRLANVRVTMRPLAGGANVHFIIEGILLIDPAPERITFDTVLELASGEYEVKGEGIAR